MAIFDIEKDDLLRLFDDRLGEKCNNINDLMVFVCAMCAVRNSQCFAEVSGWNKKLQLNFEETRKHVIAVTRKTTPSP